MNVRRNMIIGGSVAAIALGATVAVVVLPRDPAESGSDRPRHVARADAAPEVWVGAPLTSTWPNDDGCDGAEYPSDECSLPTSHHIVYVNPSNGELDDWAADLQSVAAGDPVALYAAPVDEGVPVDAVVQSVGPACASGDPADGGYAVGVELSSGGTKIGTVTYAHIEPEVNEGDVINRWDTRLGTVGSYTAGSCWTGVHVHVEMSSQTNYACFDGTLAPGSALEATNGIGMIGGDLADERRQPCP